jgi:hypothetical protein
MRCQKCGAENPVLIQGRPCQRGAVRRNGAAALSEEAQGGVGAAAYRGTGYGRVQCAHVGGRSWRFEVNKAEGQGACGLKDVRKQSAFWSEITAALERYTVGAA